MRGRMVRRLLLPHILRLFLMGLVIGALIFTLLLMVRLAIDLVNETNHLNTSQLSTDQVLNYIKHFFVLSLIGALQLLGASVFVSNDENTLKWTLFGWCSSVCGLLLFIDAFVAHGCLMLSVFMLIQGFLVALYKNFISIPANVLLSGQSTDVHYIQMPSEVPILSGSKKPKFLPF